MAGTSDDFSTEEFRLLQDEYRLAVRLVGEKLAVKLVQRFLEEGELDRDGRVRYKIWMIEALPGGLTPSPYDGAFWRSDPERGIHCEIDHQNSSACWTGPASAEWKAFDGRQNAKHDVSMIRLCHELYMEFLHSAGALPERAQSGEPSTSEGRPAAQSAPESSSGLTPASEPQSAKRVRLKDWLPGAVERWPRDKTDTDDYPEFLRKHAPGNWTRHYIQTELSALAKEKRTKKS